MAAICQEEENGDLSIKNTHPYFYQIQGQMVFYTHKGISTVDVDFDEDFWKQCKLTMSFCGHFICTATLSAKVKQ